MAAAQDRLSDTRAKMLTESLEKSNEPRFGYFGMPGPLCIGDDSYAPKAVRKVPENPDAEPIRQIQTGPGGKLFSFSPPLCLDDPYQDPIYMVKRGKQAMLDPEAPFRPPGSVRRSINKLGYDYVEHGDQYRDPKAIREKYRDYTPPRAILSGYPQRGGPGVYVPGILFGFGDERKFPEHLADDYDAAKKKRRKELEEHLSKLQETPFRPLAYGNSTFATNEETFHCEEPSHVPRDPQPNVVKAVPHEQPFRPAGPSKKGMLYSLMSEYPKHIEDPPPVIQRRPKEPEGEERPAFRLNAPIKVPKPTPSVTTMTRNMRNERPSSFARPLL